MSEKYVKDILQKLEEIENLHAKLRSLVPRVKNQESENTSNIADKYSESLENKESIAIETKENQRNSSETLKNSSASNMWFTKHLRKLKNPLIIDKYRKLKNNSVNFVTEQWHNKKDKLTNLLSTINERNVILVNRGAQTSDCEQSEGTSRKRSVTGSGEIQFSSRENPVKRKRAMQELLERLLEHFNYSRDSDIGNESRVSIHDHALGNNEPHRVQKAFLLLDGEAETSRIILSARRVSVDANG
ncbi:uncharacterized protein LOC143344338 [Colletes latitarsis]|uniref:uncharacterized protein LOC143344338 n=1 Tax=Colletes latitarsis TaxID=2605962 RepID=UPI0040353AFF